MVNDFGENKGYKIIERVQIGHHIFSLGHNSNAPNPYVVWQSNSTTPECYYWGHYANEKNSAFKNLKDRIKSETVGILQNIDRMTRRPDISEPQ
ncbi:hypothetical protein LJC27_06410, partial [Christensenellaceae bacterium OttesenSCG-928-M15]|nr:hypothetical protein [Christensenellaceae bacterium OttesenSCG-928-M15]